jgi:hypothetical protein
VKKKQSQKNRNTKAAIAATIMAVPIFGMPSKGLTQVKGATESSTEKAATTHLYLKYEAAFEKHKGDLWIAGVGDGHSIYQNARGEYFYIDPSTGDMKFLSSDYFIKGESSQRKAFVLPHVLEKSGTISSKSSSSGIKRDSKVTLLGVDQMGNVIQENSKGEKFYLNTKTGDMVFVK